MAAWGLIDDGRQVIATVKDGLVRRNSNGGEVVGYEIDGEIYDLDRNHVGHLYKSGGPGVSAWWLDA